MTFYDDYEAEERAELYKLFAGLFLKAPDDEILTHLRDVFGMGFTETSYETAADFENLFSGYGLHMKPYESLYNYPYGDGPRVGGKATDEVRAFYRSAGLMIDEAVNPVPDHISLELIFMSYLIENGLSEQQRAFMEEHLLKWIPEYCDAVASHAHTVFYKEAAALLKGFIIDDYKEATG